MKRLLEDRYTLLDVVRVVGQFAHSDEELMAAVTYLVNSGKIKLCGDFAGSKFEMDKRPELLVH